jgi:hypothetical protein
MSILASGRSLRINKLISNFFEILGLSTVYQSIINVLNSFSLHSTILQY